MARPRTPIPRVTSTGTARARRGFTLTELMVAVAVLIVVVLATGKIFGTAGKVTAIGGATADVLQEFAVFERQLRSDFERLSRDGFFAIVSNEVANDIHWQNGGPLLNPHLPPEATVRADQLVFFVNGPQDIQTYAFDQFSGSSRRARAAVSRVYYGHAFQLPQGDAIREIDDSHVRSHDPAQRLTPWETGPVGMRWTDFTFGGPEFESAAAAAIDGTQPEARKWLLVRQPVLLADDGLGNVTEFIDNHVAGYGLSVNTPQVLMGRVDAVAQELDDLRRALVGVNSVPDTWGNSWGAQRGEIANNYVYFPRAERFPAGPHRVDQALTGHVLSSACSSFRIDWTYEHGTGEARDAEGNLLQGFDLGGNPVTFGGIWVPAQQEQPWFGLTPQEQIDDLPSDQWSPIPFSDSQYAQNPTFAAPALVNPALRDRAFLVNPDWKQYWAIFGFNQSRPIDPNTGRPWDHGLTGVMYTPWPSAIRITMTLHDPETNLEGGREFQFVIRLPKRTG